MFSRYFLTLCLVLFVAAVVSVSAEQEPEYDFDDSSLESIELRSKTLNKVIKILKNFFKHATEECLKAAAEKCKKHWYNPAKVIQCAKDFFSIENIGCVVSV